MHKRKNSFGFCATSYLPSAAITIILFLASHFGRFGVALPWVCWEWRSSVAFNPFGLAALSPFIFAAKHLGWLAGPFGCTFCRASDVVFYDSVISEVKIATLRVSMLKQPTPLVQRGVVISERGWNTQNKRAQSVLTLMVMTFSALLSVLRFILRKALFDYKLSLTPRLEGHCLSFLQTLFTKGTAFGFLVSPRSK